MDLLKRSIFLKQVKIKYINIQLITDRYFPFAIFIYYNISRQRSGYHGNHLIQHEPVYSSATYNTNLLLFLPACERSCFSVPELLN